MTHNLTNEQVTRVQWMYYGAEVLVTSLKEGFSWVGNKRVTINWNIIRISESGDVQFQLLLTPLHAISDEDAIEVANIGEIKYPLFGIDINERRRKLIKAGWDLVLDICEGLSTHRQFSRLHANFIFQYLTQKSYAVPLFFEPGHPDNGKDAIELGLAIDKTKTK